MRYDKSQINEFSLNTLEKIILKLRWEPYDYQIKTIQNTTKREKNVIAYGRVYTNLFQFSNAEGKTQTIMKWPTIELTNSKQERMDHLS